jgi:uncharacterized protein (TIGR02679 family)
VVINEATSGDLDRVRHLLDTPPTAWLLTRMRGRLASTGELSGTVSKSAATSAERAAAARLVGRPVRAGQSASVSLDALDATLRRTGAWPDGLTSAVVALTGTVVLPSVRVAEREAWRQANDVLRELAGEHPQLAPWADGVIRAGTLKRAAAGPDEAHEIADRLAALARALPVDGESLGAFSARVAGDAHALDAQTSLGALAAGLASHLGGNATHAATGTARWRRDAWQCVGVVVDELSSTVLALGLPGGAGSPTARALAELAGAGQPAILTLRQLMADAVGGVPLVVHVCENPAVIAAAADRQPGGAGPLVCVGGQPGSAVVRLLRTLVDGGARLRYHGDFDWGGMSIARTLAHHVPWEPWRLSAADYDHARSTLAGLPTLRGTPGTTPWDPALAEAMASARVKIEEELLLPTLLADLDAGRLR